MKEFNIELPNKGLSIEEIAGNILSEHKKLKEMGYYIKKITIDPENIVFEVTKP